MKFRDYISEESDAAFFNNLMSRITQKFGRNMMMRNRKNGFTAVIPVNSFDPLKEEFVKLVKSKVKPGPESEISNKAIVLTQEEWKETGI